MIYTPSDIVQDRAWKCGSWLLNHRITYQENRRVGFCVTVETQL
ncbi:hypothetical protein SNE40_009853 [Patella caerulea]|uniref:Uncharacterized protein n=1 Tax=Patella caerulea TaxID=87958 RepID=A0AAN8JZH8_PATCE